MASPSAVRPAGVPVFTLYGEPGRPGVDLLHLESIASRSHRYRWEIDAHVHQGLYQVLWLQAGHVQAWLDAEQQAADGPVVITIPAGVVHAFRFSAQSQGCVLTISARALVEGDAEAAAPALRDLFATPRLLPLGAGEGGNDAARIASLFALLHAEYNAPRPAGSPVPLWLARTLVWRLGERAGRQRPAAQRARSRHQALFTRFLELVEAQHAAHWPVSRYAARLGLSTERLNRLVRAEDGRSALELVHERLAREACRRLAYVAAPISKLAFELGFEDPAYFCRFFKRRLGCSPREWRQRCQSEGRTPPG